MTEEDYNFLHAVVNRMGRSELIVALENIYERLEALEKTRAPKEDESSSKASKEPVHHQKQHQS